VVEIDGTFLGGKDRAGGDDKASALGMVERTDDVQACQIPARDRRHILPIVSQWVVQDSRVMTDEARVCHT
jgi:ISXO2-like transposase domain